MKLGELRKVLDIDAIEFNTQHGRVGFKLGNKTGKVDELEIDYVNTPIFEQIKTYKSFGIERQRLEHYVCVVAQIKGVFDYDKLDEWGF